MNKEITYLGKVINVNSSKVEVEISNEIPSAAPIIKGKVYKIGQIGTFVKFPLGNLTLYGIVSSVSNTPESEKENDLAPNYGKKFLTVQLIGEQVGNAEFKKGVGTFPTINDEVHIVLEEDLKLIYGETDDGYIEIGKHASSDNLSVNIDLHNLVLRHSAILGSTGSGKSNTNAHLIKKILSEYQGSRMVLIDPHGEYEAAFKNKAKVFKINSSKNPLFIPFWTMNFDELAHFLVGRPEGQERPADKRLREEILRKKRANCDQLEAGSVNENFVTVDSPIPFDLRELWYKFNRELNATYSEASKNEQTEETERLVEEGSPEDLIPAKFEPYEIGGGAPYKSKKQTMFDYERKILSRLKDDRYDFMFNPGPYKNIDSGHDIDKLLRNWIDHDKRLTILDLSGVPFEFVDISVGLITRFLFDSMYWGRFEDYTGRKRPLFMIFEEAHNYLPSQESSFNSYGYATKAVEKIFKEGRKFGIGGMVISQRPSEISKTILAQIGTYIALRLTNSRDKNTVQSSAPNNMSSLIEQLPSLRIGEAIVVGEAIKIPSRARIDEVQPRPSSNDPDLVKNWNKNFDLNEEKYKNVVTKIRAQKDNLNQGDKNGTDTS